MNEEMSKEMSKEMNEEMSEEMNKDQIMNEIDKLHAAGLQQGLYNAALETRRLRVENEELTEKLWATEKALNDAVLNLQRLRDKLNAERAKHSKFEGKAFMGDLREWHGEF